jgi:hypothetical protein
LVLSLLNLLSGLQTSTTQQEEKRHCYAKKEKRKKTSMRSKTLILNCYQDRSESGETPMKGTFFVFVRKEERIFIFKRRKKSLTSRVMCQRNSCRIDKDSNLRAGL